MAADMHATNIYGGTGGAGGAGGQQGGGGGTGQGNIVQIHTNSVQVHDIQSIDYDKLMDFLSPINYLPRQQEIFKTRHKDTGNWLLEHSTFLEWKSGSPQVLWCSGIPGSGKTVLSSLAFNHLKAQDNTQIGVACAFLNYKESSIQTTENILGALLRQLASEQELEPAWLIYKKRSKQKINISLDDIQQLFTNYAYQYEQVYVILDALDEYSSENKDELLEIILDMADNIQLLVTCRPHILPPESLQLAIFNIHPPDDDIRSYITAQLSQSRRLRRHAEDKDLKEQIIESITSKAAGMFLFVKLQMDLLSSALTKNALLQRLETLPANLHSLYTKTLEHIKLETTDLRDIGLSALAWVAFAKRPLTVLELRAALAIPGSQPLMPDENSMVEVEDLLEACHGLLIVNTTREGDVFRLVHYSTQEFMDSIQSQEFPSIHISISRTLLFCLQWAIDSGDFPEEDYQWNDDIDLEIHPLLVYSQYLLAHATGEAEASLVNELLRGIYNIKRYPQWIADPWKFMPQATVTPLWIAVAGNLEYLVEKLLELEEDPTQIEDAGNMIHIASHHGYLKQLEILRAAQIEISQDELDEALCLAVQEGHKEIAKYLVNWGADVNARLDNQTPLYTAAEQGYYKIAEFLLQSNADPDCIGGEYGTALQAAAYKGHQEIVNLLLCADADATIEAGKCRTALQAAVSAGYQHIVELLLQANADPDLVDRAYGAAIKTAAFKGYQEIVELLLLVNADSNLIDYGYGTALKAAAFQGQQQITQLLLEANADPNIVVGEYGTAIQAAASRGHQMIVQLLLEANADPNLTGGRYGSPLQAAACEGFENIVQLLLQENADPNIVGAFHGTALHAAAREGHCGIVQLLLQADADPNLIAGHYGTALQAAAYWEHLDIVQLLIEANADPNLLCGCYGTSLQAAACGGELEIVQYLLDHNAEPNLVGGKYETALQAALAQGHKQIAQLLLAAGAEPDLASDYAASDLDWQSTESSSQSGSSRSIESSNHSGGSECSSRSSSNESDF